MFQKLGRFTYRRRRWIAAIWLVIFVGGIAMGGTAMKRLSSDMHGGNDAESQQVAERLRDLDPNGGRVVAIVDGASVDSPHVKSEVQAAAAELRARPDVKVVYDYYSTGMPALVAKDGQASLVAVELSKPADRNAGKATTDAVTERLRHIDAPTVKVGGDALLGAEFEHAAEKDLSKGESAALPIAMVAMIVIFGGVVAAGLPLIIAFVAVASCMFVLLAATGFTEVSVFAINVISMLGLGLGIDYGLLLVSRFKEERGAGREIPEAVERTVATAGMTVAFSGLTVATALAGLFAFDNPTFRSFGIAGIGVVTMSMAAALTLLPALLGLWGKRIKPAKAPKGVGGDRDHGYFARLARIVQKRAVAVVAVVGIALAALAVPFLSARFQASDARSLPRSSETRAVALTMAERFPAVGAEPVKVIADADASSPEVAAYAHRITGLAGVASVMPQPGTPSGMTVLDVYPKGASQGEQAELLVHELRGLKPEFRTQVGGMAAMVADTKDSIASRLPLALAIIGVATFVLLFLMTGSIAVPVKAILMNLLSLGASFGGLVWVFQDGHLSNLLGFESMGAIDLFMPVLIFIFAFGLSMDYEVFLLSRIKEVYDETGDNDRAVQVGLQRTGRIITSAALLIVVVFAGFATGEVLMIKQLGFGLALAVIVDATIVRSLLVPATMKLLGDWNWWAPRPLRRLHERIGLKEPASTPTPSARPSLGQIAADEPLAA